MRELYITFTASRYFDESSYYLKRVVREAVKATLDYEDFPYDAVGIPRDYPWARGRVNVPVWHWKDRVIWGLTARIVQDICRQD